MIKYEKYYVESDLILNKEQGNLPEESEIEITTKYQVKQFKEKISDCKIALNNMLKEYNNKNILDIKGMRDIILDLERLSK